MDFDIVSFLMGAGELPVFRTVEGVVDQALRTHGLQGWTIRSLNGIRRAFGLRNNTEASAVFAWARDRAANGVVNLNVGEDDDLGFRDLPFATNVEGPDESSERFLVSGVVPLVDDDGNTIRWVTFVMETDLEMTLGDFMDTLRQNTQGIVERYEDELQDILDGGGLSLGDPKVTFAAQRG